MPQILFLHPPCKFKIYNMTHVLNYQPMILHRYNFESGFWFLILETRQFNEYYVRLGHYVYLVTVEGIQCHSVTFRGIHAQRRKQVKHVLLDQGICRIQCYNMSLRFFVQKFQLFSINRSHFVLIQSYKFLESVFYWDCIKI